MQFNNRNDNTNNSLSAPYSHHKKISIFSNLSDISEYKSMARDSRSESIQSTPSIHLHKTAASVFSEKPDANHKLKKHLLKTLHYLMRSSIYIKNRRKSAVPTFKTSRRIWKPKELKSFYQNIKNNATNYIITNMILQLATIFNKDKRQENVHLDILPHQLFSWNRDHFIERRSLTDFVYIEILHHNCNKNQLIHLKFIKDLSELMRYCALIHNEYFMRKSNRQKIIQKELCDAKDLTNMETKLTRDYNDFRELKMLFKHKISDVAYRFFETFDAQRTYNLQLVALDSKVIRSIEYRYETGLLEAEAEFLIYNENMKVNALEDEINYYNELIKRDEQCHDIVLNALNTFHAKYMDKLDFWSQKCDTEFDFADEEIFMLKFRIAQAEENYNRMEKLLERCQNYNRLSGLEVQETYFVKAERKGTKDYQQSLVEEANRGEEIKIILQKLHERLKKIFK